MKASFEQHRYSSLLVVGSAGAIQITNLKICVQTDVLTAQLFRSQKWKCQDSNYLKYIFNFKIDYENRRTLTEKSIKAKMMRDYKILCYALILLWRKINQHVKKKIKRCLTCCNCSRFPHKATQLYNVMAVSPFRPSKAKRSAWFMGIQFDILQKQNIP